MLVVLKIELDRGSIRSSPRDGLSVLLTVRLRSNVGLFHYALVYMSILDASILIFIQQVSLMMFSLTMVDYSMSFLLLSSLNFFGGQVEGTILRYS